MVKSGLIIGAIAFVLVLGVSAVLSPLCAPCPGLFAGLAAGYLAGVFGKPLLDGEGAKSGAIAGAITGGLGWLGSFVAALINSAAIAPSGNAAINELLGLPPADPVAIWIGQFGIACCLGLFNVAWMAGLGAAGGALWVRMNRKDTANPDLTAPPTQ